MKALAILAVCLAAASPALAFPGSAPHAGPGPHVGPAAHPGPAMMGHGRHRHGGRNLFFDPFGPQVLSAYPANVDAEPAAGLSPSVELPPPTLVQLTPGPFCPPPEPPPPRLRHTGPRIIYIGRQPSVKGPDIIYGTD